ncbi:uncharacterized protein LOC116684900 [Etheostoma spectabile]|uniref:uncharacterized protein LOC116684900 n=1 Tax=Etheostoma spectabile TaxID=54343 RepID=UPI0013AEEF5C|nr:uncharacterized protein LOC116684900 [Etheostoma spectabile]
MPQPRNGCRHNSPRITSRATQSFCGTRSNICKFMNIREILNKTTDGKCMVLGLEEQNHISIKERCSMVRILVSHLIERFGENPSSGAKALLASSIVDQFPCLRDCQGTGYDAWFTPGRSHKPATGFLEERLRNVRKRLHSGRRVHLTSQVPQHTRVILPEPTITPERAIQLTEWLKNNIWPQSQVGQHMLETALHRAQWIRSNGTTSLLDIITEFPRLVDTPGMISQDFSVLHPESSGRLTENWNPLFSAKIICMAKKEKTADLLANIDSLSGDKQGDIALQLLPVLLPAAPYRLGKRVVRPSSLETRRAFIHVQPIATNMADYLMRSSTEPPYVLMLGKDISALKLSSL